MSKSMRYKVSLIMAGVGMLVFWGSGILADSFGNRISDEIGNIMLALMGVSLITNIASVIICGGISRNCIFFQAMKIPVKILLAGGVLCFWLWVIPVFAFMVAVAIFSTFFWAYSLVPIIPIGLHILRHRND